MKPDEFRQLQAESGLHFLGGFIWNCRAAYLAAAKLVGLDPEQVERMLEQKTVSESAAWALMPAFEFICSRYRDRYFTTQLDIFGDPSRSAENLWRNYLFHQVQPALLAEPLFVRESLKAAGLLPAENRIAVMKALVVLVEDAQIPAPRIVERRSFAI